VLLGKAVAPGAAVPGSPDADAPVAAPTLATFATPAATSAATETFDVIVVGAGVVGCATAVALGKQGPSSSSPFCVFINPNLRVLFAIDTFASILT
jgi:hypothetical protein